VPLSKSVVRGMSKLQSRMRAGELNMTPEESSAIGGAAEFHAIAGGFLQDAHENMGRSRKIGDMVQALPPEIRSILPDELKREVAKQNALCEAWMAHAESFVYDEAVIESDMDITDHVGDNVESLISRANNRKNDSESSEKAAKSEGVVVPLRR